MRNNLGPVLLEVRIRYLAELRFGNEVTVSVENTSGTSKTWKVHHRFTRPDGTVAAEVDTVRGLFDPTTRRLAANPRGAMQSLAAHPDLARTTRIGIVPRVLRVPRSGGPPWSSRRPNPCSGSHAAG